MTMRPWEATIKSGEEAGSHGDIANGGIGDAGAEAHFFGVGGHQGEERERFHPDDVGVEDPAVGEAGGFGLAGEGDDAVDGDVGFYGDAEFHCSDLLKTLRTERGISPRLKPPRCCSACGTAKAVP